MTVALFDELLFNPLLFRKREGESYPVSATLEYANSQPRNAQTGVRTTSVGRLDPTQQTQMDVGLLSIVDQEYINQVLRGGYGSAYGMRFYLPHDHSITLGPVGTADGSTTQFKVVKEYQRPGDASHINVRRIYKPVVQMGKEKNGFQLSQADGATSRVPGAGPPNYFDTAFRVFFQLSGVNTEQTTGWTVDAKTGILYFATAPPLTTPTTKILVTCVFDTPMAFDGNSFTMLYDYPNQAQYTLRELLGPELGLS